MCRVTALEEQRDDGPQEHGDDTAEEHAASFSAPYMPVTGMQSRQT